MAYAQGVLGRQHEGIRAVLCHRAGQQIIRDGQPLRQVLCPVGDGTEAGNRYTEKNGLACRRTDDGGKMDMGRALKGLSLGNFRFQILKHYEAHGITPLYQASKTTME